MRFFKINVSTVDLIHKDKMCKIILKLPLVKYYLYNLKRDLLLMFRNSLFIVCIKNK